MSVQKQYKKDALETGNWKLEVLVNRVTYGRSKLAMLHYKHSPNTKVKVKVKVKINENENENVRVVIK